MHTPIRLAFACSLQYSQHTHAPCLKTRNMKETDQCRSVSLGCGCLRVGCCCAAGSLLLRMGPGCSCSVAAPRHLALAMSAFGTALLPWVRVRAAAGNTNTCAGQVRVRSGPAVLALASCRWPQERHCAGLQVPAVAGLACGVGLGRGAARFIGSRGRISTGAVGHELATGHM